MLNRKLKRIFYLSTVIFIVFSCNNSDPYSEGMHWDYSITCEGGFVYKILANHRGTILVLNSDGTPLRCGKKKY